MRTVTHFIDGQSSPAPGRTAPIYEPSTGQIRRK